jgi:hypothetical protein
MTTYNDADVHGKKMKGAKAYWRDLPKTELTLLDTGRFALEEEGDFIAERSNALLSWMAGNY